jgi:hypothetical protein
MFGTHGIRYMFQISYEECPTLPLNLYLIPLRVPLSHDMKVNNAVENYVPI